MRAERARLTSQVTDAKARQQAAQATHDQAAAAVQAAKARLAGIAAGLVVDVPATEAALAEAQATIETARAAFAQAQHAEAVQDEVVRLLADILASEALGQMLAAAEWACARVRDEDLAQKAEGIEARLAKFLGAAGRDETPYLRAGKGGAAFGWRTPDGTEVDLAALSGGETVCYRAALAYAILGARAPQLRLLVVELAEAADGHTAEALLSACASIADECQTIAASCAPVSAPAAWTVVDFGAVAPVAG